MNLIDNLLATLPNGLVREVRVGPFLTAVVVEVKGNLSCGLASTLGDENHHHGGGSAVRDAGELTKRSARAIAELVHSQSSMEAAIGMAAIMPCCQHARSSG